MSTPSPEKHSLLGLTVHEKIAYKILKMEVFFGSPFNFSFQSSTNSSSCVYFYKSGNLAQVGRVRCLLGKIKRFYFYERNIEGTNPITKYQDIGQETG